VCQKGSNAERIGMHNPDNILLLSVWNYLHQQTTWLLKDNQGFGVDLKGKQKLSSLPSIEVE
jgi:hypothetical protein